MTRKTMTHDEFYDALAEVAPRFRWTFHENGRIRGFWPLSGYSIHCCPISACGRPPQEAMQYVTVARRLGLPIDISNDIARAADNKPNHNPRTRAALLRAVGLEEA